MIALTVFRFINFRMVLIVTLHVLSTWMYMWIKFSKWCSRMLDVDTSFSHHSVQIYAQCTNTIENSNSLIIKVLSPLVFQCSLELKLFCFNYRAKLKQNKYPVLFLTDSVKKASPSATERTKNIQNAINFANSIDLLVCFQSEGVLSFIYIIVATIFIQWKPYVFLLLGNQCWY